MKSPEAGQIIVPRFVDSKLVQVAIATSAFCNAMCEFCVWPFMRADSAVMSLDAFRQVLDRFEGLRFSELALSVINEPFVDRTVCQKLAEIARRRLPVTSLFFSSNWLLPKPDRITDFVGAIEECLACPTIGNISINATVCGIDEETYDRGQAGSTLTGTVAKYRRLDFQRAVANVCEVLRRLSALRVEKPLLFAIKAYTDQFDQQQMTAAWQRILCREGIPAGFVRTHVRLMLNHKRITFARFDWADHGQWRARRTCASHFLTEKLVVGAKGEVGLCCQDGIRTVVIGNILEEPLAKVVSSTAYQEHLRVVMGLQSPEAAHPCQRCEFYTSEPGALAGSYDVLPLVSEILLQRMSWG